MRRAVRVLFIDERSHVRLLSLKRVGRLVRREPGERIPELAGEYARFAFATLELFGCSAVDLRRIDYVRIPFDRGGRVDLRESERAVRLLTESHVSVPASRMRQDTRVLDARPLVARSRYEREFKWRPTRDEEEAILRQLLG